MKRIITFLFIMTVFTVVVKSQQSIINGDFETWQTTIINEPTGAITINMELFQRMGPDAPLLVTRVTDAHQGTYACKLETAVIQGDTAFGYCVFGKTGESGPEGGFPYTQKPDSIVGWYKSDINAADSALLLVAFSLGGSPVYQNMFFLKGTHNTYTRFSFPLNLPGGFACDTVLMGVASSDPFTDFVPKPGSWIIVDDISFVGVGITQQVPNSNFELWASTSFEKPAEWMTFFSDTVVASVEKTTDKYAGVYAAKVTTMFFGSQLINTTFNGRQGDDGPTGGNPFSLQTDTLIGYYKYIPQGGDTAMAMIQFRKDGLTIDWRTQYLAPASTYTQFSLPFDLSIAPDSIVVFLASSTWNATPANVGSILYVDEVQLKSQPLFTSIKEHNNVFINMIYPNPAKDQLNIDYTLTSVEPTTVSVYDLTGKLVSASTFNGTVGTNSHIVNISNLAKGMYTLTIQTKTQHIRTTKFIVR